MKPTKTPLIVYLQGREVSVEQQNLTQVVSEAIDKVLREEAEAGRTRSEDDLHREVMKEVFERAVLPPVTKCEVFTHPAFKGRPD